MARPIQEYIEMTIKVLSGEKLESVADEYETTRERVRQIVEKYCRQADFWYFEKNKLKLNDIRIKILKGHLKNKKE